jgi:hypothetical protein
MQPLSVPKSDSLYLSYFFLFLEFSRYPERLSDNVILRREPKNLEILRVAQDDNSGGLVVVGLLLPFILVRKDTQNQRHEVCLKYKGLEYWSNGGVE